MSPAPSDGGQLHHARQHARRLDDRDRGLAAERVAARELDDEVEALVDDLRERVRRVEPDRRHQRAHVLAEVGRDPGALRGGELAAAQELDALPRERRQHLRVEARVLVVDHRVRHRRDLDVLGPELGHRHPGRRRLRAELVDEPRHPDLEELVEVRRDDRQVAQPLEERDRRVLRERQHAPVERDERELAVDRRVVDGIRHGRAHRFGAGRRVGSGGQASQRAPATFRRCDSRLRGRPGAGRRPLGGVRPARSRGGSPSHAACPASRSSASQTQLPRLAASSASR